MTEEEFFTILLPLIIKFFLGFMAFLFAILLWSKTREISWVMVILSTLSLYIKIVFNILSIFKIYSLDVEDFVQHVVLRPLIDNAYILFLLIGLVFAFLQARRM
jgi:hypothetical protein